MSILVVGASHASASIPVLERLALDADSVDKLLADVHSCEHVDEAVVLATCNRVEVYAEVDRFHASVEEISALLGERSGIARDELARYLYVHYDEGAVAHAFAVASGLDSMVVGEQQILGQVRAALRRGQEAGAVGSALNTLFQQSLRVGKRAHAETGIDHFGPSLVAVGLDQAEHSFPDGLAGRRALVIGAGSMAALAAATLRRRGVSEIVVVNRSLDRAAELAAAAGARVGDHDALLEEIAAVDVVVSCTGAMALVISAAELAAAVELRAQRPLAVLDLALPHDVAPEAAHLPGVRLVALRDLADSVAQVSSSDVAAVRAIVAAEVAGFAATRRAAQVTPTLVALRSMASGVVDAELARLAARLPELDTTSRAELEATVRRVADKLLHNPTVRIKQLAGHTAESSYADALAELFALDRAAVDAVTLARVVQDSTSAEDQP